MGTYTFTRTERRRKMTDVTITLTQAQGERICDLLHAHIESCTNMGELLDDDDIEALNLFLDAFGSMTIRRVGQGVAFLNTYVEEQETALAIAYKQARKSGVTEESLQRLIFCAEQEAREEMEGEERADG
jgi:hypothetical protein